MQKQQRPPIAIRRGLTLLELMVSIVVLTVAVYLLSSTVTSTVAHSRSKQELALAVDAAQNALETLRAKPFSQVFALYDHDPGNDPGGAGTAPGPWFDVEGLDPQEGVDAPPRVGEIIFPSEGPHLPENTGNPVFGFPRDLSGDTRIDLKDHAADYAVLPVMVQVSWNGLSGPREFRMSTMLTLVERAEDTR